MARDIEGEVRENRRKVQRLETYYRQPVGDQSTSINTPEVRVTMNVSVTVYTRPLNDTLVGGNPDPTHQPPRGVAGDRRGSWTQTAASSTSAFVDEGKRALIEALAGTTKGVDAISVGTGASEPYASDTALESETNQVIVWYDLGTADTTRWLADFRFNEFGDTINEVGIWTEAYELVARITTGGVDPTASEEVKLEIELTVSPETGSAVAVTDATVISNALATPTADGGLDQIGIGTDDTNPAPSDTSLGNEVIQKAVAYEGGPSSITPYTVIIRSEPSTQPHEITELGVYDDTGSLAWRTTFAAETKDDRTRMRPQSALRIQ